MKNLITIRIAALNLRAFNFFRISALILLSLIMVFTFAGCPNRAASETGVKSEGTKTGGEELKLAPATVPT